MKSPLIEPLESRIAPAVISIAAPGDNPKNEGSVGGTTDFDFVVSISEAPTTNLDIDLHTEDITAIAGEDYVAQTGHVTILAGQTSAIFKVKVNQDQDYETNEDFRVVVDLPQGSPNTLSGDGLATATIVNDDALPTLSIADAKVYEGNSGTTTLTFTVSLSHKSYLPVSFDWETLDAPAGPASATSTGPDADYVPHAKSSVTIPANATETSTEVSVTINGDVDATELDEIFFAKISNATNVLSITKDQATGTIGNDDRLVTLTTTPTSNVSEGNDAVFHVALTNNEIVDYDITVTYKIEGIGDSVIAGSDFEVPAMATVTIPAGQNGVDFTVRVLGDSLHEHSEQFKVSIVDVKNAKGDDSTVTGTIADDDAPPVVSVIAPASGVPGSVAEGSTAGADTVFNFRLQLDRVSGVDTFVHVSLVDGTATLVDGDFTALTAEESVVKIKAGDTFALVPVKVKQDAKYENSETFFLQITSADDATVGTPQAQATILNDDATPRLSISDVSVLEGAAGEGKDVTFTVSLIDASGNPVTSGLPVSFDWAAVAGTASEGEFVPVPDPINGFHVTIPAGSSPATATLTVHVNGDDVDEIDEKFFINLSNATVPGQHPEDPLVPLTIAKSQAVGTILNDDLTVSIASPVAVQEGAADPKLRFIVSIPQATDHDVTVFYSIVDGTAKAGKDFTPSPGQHQVTIKAGDTSAFIDVTVIDDAVYDSGRGSDETFTIHLDSAVNAKIDTATATGQITDNEQAPKLVIDDATITEGNSGSKILTFKVHMDTAADEDVLFDWITVDGSAHAGTDFTGVTAGHGVIAAATAQSPAQKEVSISVTIAGDTVFEANENFFVQLSNAHFAGPTDNNTVQIQRDQATGTISNDDAAPTLSIDDVQMVEGNDPLNPTEMKFRVKLSQALDQDVTFDWATTFGTATPGSDYSSVSLATATILAGSTFVDIGISPGQQILIFGDTTDEADEIFFVNLANAKLTDGTSLNFSRSQATGTIQNDDVTVHVGAPTLTVQEGDTGTTDAVFTIQLSQAANHPVTVNFILVDGTAKVVTDYIDPTGTNAHQVTFQTGETQKDIHVQIVGDKIFEGGNETFDLKLTTATGAVVGPDNLTTATITDTDAKPTIKVTGTSIQEGDNGVKNLVFTVTLSNPTTEAVSFDWSTMDDGTAVGVPTGNTTGDYTISSGHATFAAGTTTLTQQISVPIIGDTTDEPDEHFLFKITEASLTGATAADPGDLQATGTILNDDLTVRIAGGQVTEGDSGTKNLQFDISLNQVSTHDVIVHLELTDGTAKVGQDYQLPASLNVTIPAGSTTVSIQVPVIGDTTNEATESFNVKLLSAENAKLGTSQATGTILDNDAAPLVSILQADTPATTAEGNSGQTDLTFTIHLSAPSGQPITVLASALSGTATSGVDFSASPQLFTFAPGETDKTFVVHVLGDTIFEQDENLTVALSNPAGATLDPSASTRTGTILNDEATPTLSITDVSQAEGNGTGTTVFTFTVALSGIADRAVTFDLATAAGSALAGVDFIQKAQSFTIAPGQTTATFAVEVKQDTLFENTEQFFVNLTNAKLGGATLDNPGDTQAVGTILNDDAQPALSINDVTIVEGDTGTQTVTFTVTMSGKSESPVTFHWHTTDDTAISVDNPGHTGLDFEPVKDTAMDPNIVTIPAGQTSVTLTVTVNGDAKDEADERFFVDLTNATAGSTALTFNDSRGEAKLLNDDLTVNLGQDVTVTEGNSGDVFATFLVTLPQASDHEVTVHYKTVNVGDTLSSGANADYSGVDDAVLVFAPGEISKEIQIRVHGDTNFDQTDQFKVQLTQVTGAKLGRAEATGTITDDDTKPNVSIDADVTKLENADGGDTTQFVFKIKLDHSSDDPITVRFDTLDGTAKSATDYTAIANQTVTFAAGETEKTVTVTVQNDHLTEGDETFTAVLSDPVNATLGAKFTALGTITGGDADDVVPKLKITGGDIVEGNNGEKFLTFTITRTGSTELPITFDVVNNNAVGDAATADNPNTSEVEAGSDYLFATQHITMAPNETSKTVQVKIYGDTMDEAKETFTLELQNVSHAVVDPASDGQAKGSILNDDLTVSFEQTQVSVTEGNSGQTDLVFIAKLSAASDHPVTVTYNVVAGTATQGSDFQPTTPMQVTIPAGQTTAEIRVPIQGDTVGENNETFTVNLLSISDGQGQLATSGTSATGTILNDDAALTISDAVVVEGNSGNKDMVFTVTLKDAAVFPVTVHYSIDAATGGFTATRDVDFGGAGAVLEGDITFNASDVVNGVATKQISIPIIGDTEVEGDEKFLVRLSNPQANGAPIDALLKGTAEGRIQDDESFLSINDVTVDEGDNGTRTAVFTITRSPSSTAPATVKVSTLDFSAISTGGSPDFIAKTETIAFAAGETTKTFTVTINGDRVFESATEIFKVILSDATGAVVVDGEGVGTIQNSADSAPTISVSDASIFEGDSGSKMMEFTVSLSGASDSPVTFKIDTANIAGQASALAGIDYTALANQTFTIPAGATSVKVQVEIFGDTQDEADGQFRLTLSNAQTTRTGDANPTNLTITRAQATGTIANDDLTVEIDPLVPVDSLPEHKIFEGNTNQHPVLAIPIRLSAITGHEVVVMLQITGGTATSGSDFTPRNLEVHIPAGQASANFILDLNGDTIYEGDETVNVKVVSATGAKLGNTTSVATISEDDTKPTVTITDGLQVTEGNSATFTVTLSDVSGVDTIIHWKTKDGGAIGGDGGIITSTSGDFKAFAEQTLVIPAGSKTATIVIPTVNDSIDEDNEDFQVVILNTSQNVSSVPPEGIAGTATIGASDFSTFSISDANVLEGNDGVTKQLVFTVTRSGSTTLQSTVHYASANGTASASAGDYAAISGDLVFAPGELSKTVTVTVNGDSLSEIDETLFVVLSNPQKASITDNSGTGTILNDEATYKLVRLSSEPITEDGPNGVQQFVEFRVERTGHLDVQGTVSYAAIADSAGANPALAGTDFTATNGTIFFPADSSGATSQMSTTVIRVPITVDTLAEGDETFKVKLSNGVNGHVADPADGGEATVTIQDNDQGNLPKVLISDAHLVEGASGTSNMVFTVKLVGPDGTTPATAGGKITVTFSTVDGAAVSGVDYTALSGQTITFEAGQTSQQINVPILGDTTDEPDETFTVKLESALFTIPNSNGATLPVDFYNGDSEATGTIQNDDLTVTVSGATEGEGNDTHHRTFTLTLSQVSDHDVSVRFITKDGTAVSTGDFADFTAITNPTLVTIHAGQLTATFDVEIKGDPYAENDENFTLQFSDLKSATMASTTFTATILNDDAAPSLSIGDATIVEGNSGSQSLVFTVTLAGATQTGITVNFNTLDDIAKSVGALIDFTAVSGSLTFDPSATGGTKTIVVPVFGDIWKELDETFKVRLTDAKTTDTGLSVTIADNEAIGTIKDDGDSILGITIRDVTVVEGNTGGTAKLSFTIETTAPVTDQAVTFTASTRAGTAKAGSDFTAFTNQAVTIPVGSSTATVEVSVTGDTAFEQSEFMFLDLKDLSSNVKGVGASGNTLFARGIILNDDIHVISAREFEYVDLDGDLVNVKFSKGSISVPLSGDSNSDFTFVTTGSTVGGRFLQKIDLSNDGLEFVGANIIVTAHPQVLVNGQILGDGKANVGAIEAAVPSPGLFQFTTGVNLGKVVVPGDLGRIIAGNVQRPAGIADLEVGSLGGGSNLPTSPTGANPNDSLVLGPIGQMTVNGDVIGSMTVIGDSFVFPIPTGGIGKIGTLVVKGQLKGSSDTNLGRIAFTGGIGSATIGGLVGGTAAFSGALVPLDDRFSTRIGSLTVLGDIRGGAGNNSGYVNATTIGAVTVGKIAKRATDPSIAGNIIGGAGQSSGRVLSSSSMGAVTVNGDIKGGSGTNSGQVGAQTTMGKVLVTGSLRGGDKQGSATETNADSSGSLLTGAFTSTVTIEGSIIGGSGKNSATLQAGGYTTTRGIVKGHTSAITIGKTGVADSGDILGGSGENSGFVNVQGNLKKFTMYGDIKGGTANVSGGILASEKLGTAVIRGSLLGGSTAAADSGSTLPTELQYSGFIQAGNIGNLTIEGHVESGQNLGTKLFGSGSIATFGTISSLQVLAKDGDDAVKGNAKGAAIISAVNGITKATFGGNVSFAEILAGYTPPSTNGVRGTLSNAGATIGTVIVNGIFSASSIVAGVDAGGDGMFGTLDDQQTLGNGSQPNNLNLVSRIASVILQSVQANAAAPSGAAYGIVAERVDSIKVAGLPVTLVAGAHNDSKDILPLEAKLKLQEV
jgi:hypothetical protein